MIVTIERYSRDGRGIAVADGREYIIDGVLLGESVEFAPKKRGDGEAAILKPAQSRVEPECGSFKRCGGCNLLFADYQEQLRIKKQIVLECLKETVPGELISDVIGMHYPFKYRNKLHIAFSKRDAKLKLGFFEEGTKRINDFKECHLHGKTASVLVSILREYAKESNIRIHDERLNREGLRFAAARFLDEGLTLTLVSSHPHLPQIDSLYEKLTAAFPKVSLWLNLNRQSGSSVFSDKFVHLRGPEAISGKICGIKFEYHPAAFIQVNDIIAAKVYADVVNKAEITPDSLVIDLYSGIGITSVLFAQAGARVYSVELSRDAVKAAISMKKACGLSEKIVNVCGDAGAELVKLSLELDEGLELLKALNTVKAKNLEALKKNGDTSKSTAFAKADRKFTVFLDPPRSGLDEKSVKALLRSNPSKIIYLSCNPATLNEDLKKFKMQFTVKSVTPYDMFPQTRHVEVLTVLELADSEGKPSRSISEGQVKAQHDALGAGKQNQFRKPVKAVNNKARRGRGEHKEQ